MPPKIYTASQQGLTNSSTRVNNSLGIDCVSFILVASSLSKLNSVVRYSLRLLHTTFSMTIKYFYFSIASGFIITTL